MSDPILQAVTRSLGQDVRLLNTISNNVANMHTPGYRRTQAIPDFAVAGGLKKHVDGREGALAQTARPLDFALRGNGYFTLMRGNERMLTRAGAFSVDREGMLVNAQGDRVLGDGGPIEVPPGQVSVDGRGELSVDGRPFAQLSIVDIAKPERLISAGLNRYRYDGAENPWGGAVVQGALEQSNVDAADEMVQLMQATRHVESMQRVISIYDKVLDTGINRLGDGQ
ncbi:flagellar hook basal-body protein [Lysobacter pythonis]|uniref:Flagellar hook basal-body protein n=1 Tax=Solilutibacter pythonis TaxID=2483112 RepID=A0A3M2HWG4_9GAMM|nr:flagellar hook basal-body protein [Lysobacter pythonis]RMH94071.1 flagellar hook basal-body protein [Lysobacter pythonis]